jgi:hypothetical protein
VPAGICTLRQFLLCTPKKYKKKYLFSLYALTPTPQNNGLIKYAENQREFVWLNSQLGSQMDKHNTMVLNVYTNLTFMLAMK